MVCAFICAFTIPPFIRAVADQYLQLTPVPTPAAQEAGLPDISHPGLHLLEEEVTKVEVIEEVFIVTGEVEQKARNSALGRILSDKKKEKEVTFAVTCWFRAA